MKNTATAEQITANGIVYNILDSTTPEQHEAKGRNATAAMMRKYKQARHLVIQRPAGRNAFHTVQFANGRIAHLTNLGAW